METFTGGLLLPRCDWDKVLNKETWIDLIGNDMYGQIQRIEMFWIFVVELYVISRSLI